MSASHRESDLTAFKVPRHKSLASHPFNGWPIGEKVPPRLNLRWETCLQNAALSRVPV